MKQNKSYNDWFRIIQSCDVTRPQELSINDMITECVRLGHYFVDTEISAVFYCTRIKNDVSDYYVILASIKDDSCGNVQFNDRSNNIIQIFETLFVYVDQVSYPQESNGFRYIRILKHTRK